MAINPFTPAEGDEIVGVRLVYRLGYARADLYEAGNEKYASIEMAKGELVDQVILGNAAPGLGEACGLKDANGELVFSSIEIPEESLGTGPGLMRCFPCAIAFCG